MQTGRSVQLQDASVGGREEGCRALFIHKRCKGSREMGITLNRFGRSFNTTSHSKMEKRKRQQAAQKKREKSQNSMQLARFATLLILFEDPEHFWSTRRPLVQSARFMLESLLVAQSHIKTTKSRKFNITLCSIAQKPYIIYTN